MSHDKIENTSWFVPMEYHSLELLSNPTEQNVRILNQFGVSSVFKVIQADALVGVTKTIRTVDAYRTNRGVDEKTHTLVSSGPKWKIRKAYRRILHRLFVRLGEPHAFQQFLELDLLVRVKQAREVCAVTSGTRVRQLVHYHTTSHSMRNGEHMATWFDVTFATPPDVQAFEPPTRLQTRIEDMKARIGIAANWAPATCQACSELDTPDSRHLRCSKCRVTHYCSDKCQKRDWREHKAHCQA